MTSIAYVSAPSPVGARSEFPLLLVLAGIMIAATLVGSVVLWNYQHYWIMYVVGAQTVIYAMAIWYVIKARGGALANSRQVVILILSVAALMRAVFVIGPPVSTDIFRYVWDGRTQSHGINPYIYMPADPALQSQRDDVIYPKINRVDTAKTIYPPAAQIVFLIASRFGETVVVMKAFVMIFEVLTMWALMRLMARRGLAPGRILLYAWNPLVLWEFAGSGHTEAIGIAFMMLSMLAADTGRRFLSGLALGAAVLSKYFPLAAAPAIYRRWDWRMPLGFVVGLVLLYAPYIGAGLGVFGSVDVYAKEEIVGSGTAFFLLHWVSQILPIGPAWESVYLAVCGILLLGAGMVVVMRRDPTRAAPVAALVLMSAFQVVVSPHYTWYLTWAVPFLCFWISPAVIWLTGTASMMYVLFTPQGRLWCYVLFWVPFFISAALEFRYARRNRSPETASGMLAALASEA